MERSVTTVIHDAEDVERHEADVLTLKSTLERDGRVLHVAMMKCPVHPCEFCGNPKGSAPMGLNKFASVLQIEM